MASQPPAGYNPEASLLQGGTATIQPVQGGGGMEAGAVPSGYNPDTSLLNTGHNVPIIAVRGGGDKEGKQEGGKGGEAYAEYVLEQYEPALEPIAAPGIAFPDTLKTEAQRYITPMKERLKQLKNFTSVPDKESNYNDIQIPNYSSCKGTPSIGFFQAIKKRYVIIEEDNPVIYIISNLGGKLSIFLQYMKFIFQQTNATTKILPKNTYVLFTGSFFSDTNAENDRLYYEFLKLKNKNLDNLYYLNELSEQFVRTSCHLTERFSQKATSSTFLFPFFEPDILLFKKQHILFQNSRPTTERNNPTVKLSEVLKEINKKSERIDLYKSFIVSPGNKFDTFIPNESTKTDEQKYVIFNYNENADEMTLPMKTDILCPKEKTCNGFKAGYKLFNLDDNSKLATGFYVVSKNTDKMPLLKEEGSVLTPEETTYLEGEEKIEPSKKVRFANEVEEKKEEVKEEVVEEEVEEPLPPLEQAFKEDPSAVKATDLEIELNAKTYKIRAPFLEGVTENWLLGIFTKDEARLLNALQFSPALLAKVFGEEKWLQHLSDFLTSLMSSSCFNDFTLLTSAECSNAEEFVKQVYFGLFTQTLNEMYDEFGTPKPKKLGELVSMLKKVGTEGETNIQEFDKYEFTGDLLNRFHVIKYDPKTSQYYTDFAEIDEAKRKLLEEVEFKRIESTDYDGIKDFIVKRFGSLKPKPSLVLPTQEQCVVVRNYITKTFEKEFLETKVETFLKTDPEAQTQKITLDIFKECIAAINAELGLDYFKIKQAYTAQLISEQQYEIKDVQGDGWCFYHALLQSVGKEPDYPMLTNDEIKTDTSDDGEVTTFLSKIKAAIQTSSQKGDWEKLYNIVYGKGKYATYLQDLNDPTKKVWADPDFGIGQAAANELKAQIEIYRVYNNNYSLIVTYKPTTITDPNRIIRLHYVNNNHYQILLKDAQWSPYAKTPLVPPAPAKRYAQYTLPGPDPTDKDCEELATLLNTPSKQHYFPNGKLNETNAYNFREWHRDRTKHPDYSIYFMAKCWDKRPDLFPKNRYGFDYTRGSQTEWMEPYFQNPRTGNPTPQEIQRIEGHLARQTIQDKDNLTETDLVSISNLSYDFSYPFIKKALENSSKYRIEPGYAATIPDFDPVTSQGGGGSDDFFDLGDPVQEGGSHDEIFDLGDPVSVFTKMRKNTTRKHRSK